jgi:ABC-type dipeptide/oligopeptide/nickel transport system permease subunit
MLAVVRDFFALFGMSSQIPLITGYSVALIAMIIGIRLPK